MVYQKFEELGRWMWEMIGLSEKHGTRFGEETITDFILLDIARQRYPNIRVIQTPKNLEAEKGTDWEWYVGANGFGWVRFAIQAKKLKIASSRYESLNQKAGTADDAELQATVLRAYADANVGVIPLYCFYNHYPTATQADHWQCPLNFEKELLGWTITPLHNVEHALAARGRKSFDYLHKRPGTIPARCLFVCPVLMAQYLGSASTAAANTFLGEPITKLAELPPEIRAGWETGSIEAFSPDFYNSQIEIYPRRILVVDVSEALPESLRERA